MDLRTDYPYSLLRKGIIRSYPSLLRNIRAEVAIIGAGISGALVAHELCKRGVEVVIADRRHVGMGSTAASTGLLQYEIDISLNDLGKMRGHDHALRSYLLCRDAIYELEATCEGLSMESGFSRRPSFQFASYKKDIASLRREFELRKQSGFGVEWLDSGEIKKRFGFDKPAGILSADGAEVDAYSLTHALLEKHSGENLQVFDHTEITKIRHQKNNVTLETADGFTINSKTLVIACGYESQRYLNKKIETLRTTYSIASEPMEAKAHWYQNCLIWETARPYLYLRTSPDNRIMIGGKDSLFTGSHRRDLALPGKARSLENEFRKLFPGIRFRCDFKWAGTFASTKDGLPYIGAVARLPHTFFALGYGGNGITFSMVASKILADLIMGKTNKNAALFSFER